MTSALRLTTARLAAHPVTLGVLWMALGYAAVMLRPLVPPDEAVLGKSATSLANLVAVRYADTIRHVGLVLALIAAAFGALLGAMAAGLLALRSLLWGVAAHPRTGRALAHGMALVLALHAGAVAWWMARYPQIYASLFWRHGGLRAEIQRFVTDRLHPGGVATVGICTVLALALWPPSGWRRGRLRVRAWGLLAATLVAIAVMLLVEPRPGARPSRAALPTSVLPNLVILASDGLRADRLTPAITPNLDALASRGTRFEHAYTAVPRTFGSWMTLLTGQYPHHHGIRSDFPRWEQVAAPFDALPRRLARAGYRTAVVSDYAGDIFGRVDLGFDIVHVPRAGFTELIAQRAIERVLPLVPALHSRPGRWLLPELRGMSMASDPEVVADEAITTLRDLGPGPFLLVVFFSTTHFPYAAPSPDYARFTDPSYGGAFRYDKTVGLGPAHDASPDDARQIRALYDGAAHAVDTAAGRVLDALEREGVAARTIVALTSDHGENLYEHARGQGHGDHLFGDEGTHVPMAIFDPRVATPRREAAVVETADLTPTLSELLDVAPPAGPDGRSLAAAIRGEPLVSQFAHAETELWLVDDVAVPRALRAPTPGLLDLLEVDDAHGQELVVQRRAEPATLFARHRMVRDDRWKVVYAPTPQGAHNLLFDTWKDPDETEDVALSEPVALARMQVELWRWMLEDPGMVRQGDLLVPRGLHPVDLVAP